MIIRSVPVITSPRDHQQYNITICFSSCLNLLLDCIDNIGLALREQQGAVSLADLEGIGVAAGIAAKQKVHSYLALLQKNVELRGDGLLQLFIGMRSLS